MTGFGASKAVIVEDLGALPLRAAPALVDGGGGGISCGRFVEAAAASAACWSLGRFAGGISASPSDIDFERIRALACRARVGLGRNDGRLRAASESHFSNLPPVCRPCRRHGHLLRCACYRIMQKQDTPIPHRPSLPFHPEHPNSCDKFAILV